MFLDAQNLFTDEDTDQAVTVSDVGDNVIDLSQNRSIGNGEAITVMFSVVVDADQTAGDEDYTFQVEYSTDAAQTTGRQLMGQRIFESGTPTAPAQNADLLVEGFKFYITIPSTSLAESAQFLGIRFVTAGTSPTITIKAGLIPADFADNYNAYPNGYTISG